MTDVCVRSFLTIDEYCAATRAWLILEGNWRWRTKLVDPTCLTEESAHVFKVDISRDPIFFHANKKPPVTTKK